MGLIRGVLYGLSFSVLFWCAVIVAVKELL